MAEDALQKIKSGAKQGNIKLEDVKDALSSQEFTSGEGLLTTTEQSKVRIS